MADQTMHVCEKCGVVRAGRKAKCPHCHEPYENAVQAPSRHGDDFYWVCLEVTFRCRMCGFDVPLNHLDMDGAVHCAKCGLEQAFQVAYWGTVLNHAQNTGDLWIDSEIGEDKCSARIEGLGDNDLTAVASPGYPRCTKCHAQLEIAADGPSTSTSCRCGEKASYEIPKAAIRMMPSLRALIADEHSTDRRAVKDNSNASAIAVACPSCNAPLEVNESSKFVTCTFCKTTSRIPDRTWFRISGKEPKAEPMWLLFQGDSAKRHEVVDQLAREKAEEARQAQRERDRQEREAGRRRAEEDKKKAEAERERAVKAADAELVRVRAESEKSATRFGIAVVVGVVAIGVGIGVWSSSSKKTTAPKTSPDEDACKAGDGKACIRLGDKYDPKFAMTRADYYKDGCNAGVAQGCTKAGDVTADYREKADLYQRGCTAGDKPGCDALDGMYASGKATPSDPAVAQHWAEKLCSPAKPAACTAAGVGARDATKAFGFFKTACDGGDAKGCNLLGHAYESASGTKSDNAAMLLAYQTACNRQQTFCYDLGRVYESGTGAQKNPAKAVGLYTQACSAGNNTACAAVRK